MLVERSGLGVDTAFERVCGFCLQFEVGHSQSKTLQASLGDDFLTPDSLRGVGCSPDRRLGARTFDNDIGDDGGVHLPCADFKSVVVGAGRVVLINSGSEVILIDSDVDSVSQPGEAAVKVLKRPAAEAAVKVLKRPAAAAAVKVLKRPAAAVATKRSAASRSRTT